MRLAGAMTIHQGMQPEFCEMVINDLARHVDALFILANGDATREAVEAAQNCPKTAAYVRVNLSYNSTNAIAGTAAPEKNPACQPPACDTGGRASCARPTPIG